MSHAFQQVMAKAIGEMGQVDSLALPATAIRRARRPYGEPRSDKVTLQLLEGEDFAEWEELPDGVRGLRLAKGAKRGFRDSSAGSTVIEFERLAPSQIGLFLQKVDKQLTPRRGLRRWNAAKGRLERATPSGKPVLLILHGTFSNSDSFIRSFRSTLHGKKFLEDAVRKYSGEIYCFDHATLAESPWINALDLQQQLVGAGKVDILAHSRGGLVARWWNHLFDPDGERCRRIVLAGSPLAGTSLASPANIRSAIRQLTSYSKVLAETSKVISFALPCAKVLHVLLQVISSVSSLTAKTPLADAAIAMVPGLMGQSRAGNNPELLRLQQGAIPFDDRYYAILSDFRSEEVGWRFWKWLRRDILADRLADTIFDGANDLVVDCESMIRLTQLNAIHPKRLLDFGVNDRVHHINYFDFEETSRFLSDTLQL